MDLVYQYMGIDQATASQIGFQMGLHHFRHLMKVYLQHLESEKTSIDKPCAELRHVQEAWQALDGPTKGYISEADFFKVFDGAMPRCFDRDIALELFRELDSDKDGRMSFKDFNDSLKFQF